LKNLKIGLNVVSKTSPSYFHHIFLFVVKATTLKQQMSKFYPQILRTESIFFIYDWYKCDSQHLSIKFAFADTILILAVLVWWL